MKKASFVVALMLLLPFGNSKVIDSFDGNKELSIELGDNGSKEIFIKIPANATIKDASLYVKTSESFPYSPKIDFGNDGIYEWKYEGIGYGNFGFQDEFENGEKEFNLSLEQKSSIKIKMPKNSTAIESRIKIEPKKIERNRSIEEKNIFLNSSEKIKLEINGIENYTKPINASFSVDGNKKIGILDVSQQNLAPLTTTSIYETTDVAQTFVPTKDGEVYKIEAVTKKIGGTAIQAGNFTCEIRTTNAALQPSNGILGSANISWAETKNSDYSTWNFSNSISVKAGTLYAIVFSSSESKSTGDQYALYLNDTNPYINGKELYSTNSGSTWNIEENKDLTFKIYIYTWFSIENTDKNNIKIYHNNIAKNINETYSSSEIKYESNKFKFEIENKNNFQIKVNISTITYYYQYPGNLSIKILGKEIFNSLYIFDEPKEINFTNEINSFLFNSSGEVDNYGNDMVKFSLNISGEIGKIMIHELSIKYFYKIKIHFENELNNYLVSKSGIVDFPIKISFGSKGRIILTGLDLVYNVKPEIISIPPKNAVVGSEYKYEIIAVDYDNDNLSYSLEKYPDGMTIEENVLKFTPKINQTDSHEVVVVVDDSNGGICKQNFSIFVKKENSKPTINSTPIENCFVNVTYIYKVNATDLDNDTLKFNLLESPKDMSIDENNGTISWLPEVKGTYYVRIEVNDSYSSVYQEFNITVKGKNNPPIIKSKANETAIQGILYEYIIIAEDLDNDNLTYKIIEPPNGMKIENNKISWLPLSIGNYSIKIEVFDGYYSVNQSFKVNVIENSKPIIKSIPKKNLKVGERYKYKVIAEDEEGLKIKYSLAIFPKGMEIDENGTIVWIPNKAGEYRVVVNVSDGFGNASQEFYIKVEESFDIQILFLSIIFLILLFAFAYVAKKYSKKKVERIAIVEDIFVVYNDGRLIFHESRRLKPELDSDTISSMLTAIQNFVKDAFVGGEEAKLGSFEYGKNKVVMEYGEYTILAIVISGLESSELRRKMRNAVIEIELKYSDVIRKWNGDLGKFDGISKLIEDYRFG